MKPSLRALTLCALGLLLVGSPCLAADGGEFAVRTAVRPLDRPLFPLGETHSGLTGFTSDTTQDAANACFEGVSDSSFQSGELVAFNVFWADTIENDLLNQYQVTWAAQLPNGTRRSATFDCDFNVAGTALQPGDPASFCCFLAVPVPGLGQTVPISWGSRSIKLQGGDSLQGVLGSISVGP